MRIHPAINHSVAGVLTTIPRIAGIVNVTPDSFSDGGRFVDCDIAIAHGHQLVLDGADLVDVGGESTRPGAQRVSAEEQLNRVLPVIEALVADGVAVSVDTTSAQVARVALEAGATMVNDVSAGEEDSGMLDMVAKAGAQICLMHKRGQPRDMQRHTCYEDVVGEVHAYLLQRARQFVAAGGAPENVYLDPGIGFAKELEANVRLIGSMSQLGGYGFKTYLGASRKTFIGQISGEKDASQRLGGSVAVALEAARQGVNVLRVHDVAQTRQALQVASALWLNR
ncbi:dihydropteroate synthase [Desulfurispira natronophila]|nr:dihydropteroate synthase [Desulfurispira natronophila]